jgi:hypothetical protein
MKKILFAFLIFLMAGQAWGATYYIRSNGSAADKAAATGPCTTTANCMSFTTYPTQNYESGDIIIRCHTPVGLPGKIWSESFMDISQTLSTFYLKTSDGGYFKVGGGYFIVQ